MYSSCDEKECNFESSTLFTSGLKFDLTICTAENVLAAVVVAVADDDGETTLLDIRWKTGAAKLIDFELEINGM